QASVSNWSQTSISTAVPSGIAPGAVNVTVTTAATATTAGASFIVPLPDFDITVGFPQVQSGFFATSVVTIIPRNNFQGQVSLQASPTPAGPSIAFNNQILPNPSYSTTMTVNWTAGQSGSWDIAVTATSGTPPNQIVHTAITTLTLGTTPDFRLTVIPPG